MSNSLAIAMGIRNKNKKGSYADGGEVMPKDMDLQRSMDMEQDSKDIPALGRMEPNPNAHIDLDGKAHGFAKGGMMLSKGGMAKAIMAKRMAKGGMINQGDNMPVNDDIDNFSAETSMEGPLGEGEYEPNRQDKIMMRKSMLNKIMARLHSDNKGY